MDLLTWLRGSRTTSVRAVSVGLEQLHAAFAGTKHLQIEEREYRRRIGNPSRLVAGDPGENGPLDLPDSWKKETP